MISCRRNRMIRIFLFISCGLFLGMVVTACTCTVEQDVSTPASEKTEEAKSLIEITRRADGTIEREVTRRTDGTLAKQVLRRADGTIEQEITYRDDGTRETTDLYGPDGTTVERSREYLEDGTTERLDLLYRPDGTLERRLTYVDNIVSLDTYYDTTGMNFARNIGYMMGLPFIDILWDADGNRVRSIFYDGDGNVTSDDAPAGTPLPVVPPVPPFMGA